MQVFSYFYVTLKLKKVTEDLDTLKFVLTNIKVSGSEKLLDKLNSIIDWDSLDEQSFLRMKDIFGGVAEDIKKDEESKPITEVIIKRGEYDISYPADILSIEDNGNGFTIKYK